MVSLYAYRPVSLYAVFLRLDRKGKSFTEKIFLGIWGITLFLPYAYAFFSQELFGLCAWNSFGTFYYFAGFNGYLLLGYYLAKDVKEWNWVKTVGVAVPLFAIGYIVTYIGFKSITANPDCTEQEMEMFFYIVLLMLC